MEINDECIKNLFKPEGKKLNTNLVREGWLTKHEDIRTYINERYNDSLSFRESLYRIIYGVEEHPLCPICGNPLPMLKSHFKSEYPYIFQQYCSMKCSIQSETRRENISKGLLLYSETGQKKVRKERIRTTDIDDEYIDTLYFNGENVNNNLFNESWFQKHKEIKDYLEHRYNDSLSINETVYRIHCHIETRPVCPVCGNDVEFSPSHRFSGDRNGNPFITYCSAKCAANSEENKQKHVDTNMKKYGVSNPMKNPECYEEYKQRMIEKYGVENQFMRESVKEKIVETSLNKYGTKSPMQNPEVVKKGEETSLGKYGVRKFCQTQDFKDFIHEHSSEIMQKQYETKKKNNSFKISGPEDRMAEILSSEYEIDRQHKTEEYPFRCDFYIYELDLYIEYNGTWTHGTHPYDQENEDDVRLLNEWKIKFDDGKKFYGLGVYVLSENDPLKISTAKKNHLNYIAFYKKIDFNQILDIIKENYPKGTTDKQLILGTI